MKKLVNCLMPSTACLLAAMPLAQAGDVTLSGAPLEQTVRVESALPGGWVAGASSTRLDPTLRAEVARQPDGAAGAVQPSELRASEIHAGYRGAVGPFDYSALVRYDSLPDLYAGTMVRSTDRGAVDRGALSAGFGWRDLYARYDYTFTSDFPGAEDARGSQYLDIGARHVIDNRTSLHLNAGDGRVRGAGNAQWGWRDVRAGFTRKLDDGWTMALNYRRVYGNASLAERRFGGPRFEGLIPGMGRGRRGLVLTLNRGF